MPVPKLPTPQAGLAYSPVKPMSARALQRQSTGSLAALQHFGSESPLPFYLFVISDRIGIVRSIRAGISPDRSIKAPLPFARGAFG